MAAAAAAGPGFSLDRAAQVSSNGPGSPGGLLESLSVSLDQIPVRGFKE